HTIVLSGLFISGQVSRRLHHHDRPVVSLLIFTDRTELVIRQSAALPAVPDIVSRTDHRLGKFFHLLLRHVNQMKRKSLCRLRPDTRKSGKLLNQTADLVTIVLHSFLTPGLK